MCIVKHHNKTIQTNSLYKETDCAADYSFKAEEPSCSLVKDLRNDQCKQVSLYIYKFIWKLIVAKYLNNQHNKINVNEYNS